jgi:adenine-specific DNA-methyltransferase
MDEGQVIPTEARRKAAQAAFDTSKSPAERNRCGQFATPNALAVEIASYVNSLIENRASLRFADPSVGTGSFYSAALSVFGRQRIESATGIEIDPVLCDVARDLWSGFGLSVVCGDFAHLFADEARLAAPNLILANPPYVRHHHIDREEKQWLQSVVRKATGVEVGGLAGLYVYFLMLATAWMEDGGYAAWLVPSEFMDVNYGVALKQYLTDKVTLVRIHRFDPAEVQFDDALVSSAVLVFRKAPPPPGHAVEFTFGGTLAGPCAGDRIQLDQLRVSRKWTLYPGHQRNDRGAPSIDPRGPTLASLFHIRRGIATGNNRFFILQRADADQRRLPSRYLRPILPSPRHLRTKVIHAAADGYPLIDPQLCVIDCDLPELTVQQRHPELWDYLKTGEVLGIKDRYLVGKRCPWYKQEQRAAAPFLCTYMGRGAGDAQPFRFILNHSKAIGTNLYLMLYPRRRLETMLRDYPDRMTELHLLLGNVTGKELRGAGRVYGGGLNKIEPSELGRISASAILERWPDLDEDVVRHETASLFPG